MARASAPDARRSRSGARATLRPPSRGLPSTQYTSWPTIGRGPESDPTGGDHGRAHRRAPTAEGCSLRHPRTLLQRPSGDVAEHCSRAASMCASAPSMTPLTLAGRMRPRVSRRCPGYRRGCSRSTSARHRAVPACTTRAVAACRLGRPQVSYQPTVTADGGAELDPERLFEHVCAVIDEELAACIDADPGGRDDDVLAQPHGCRRRRRPLTPVYLWLDARSRAEMPRLRAELDEPAVHARTGCMLHWSYWPAKLAWLRRTQPDARSDAFGVGCPSANSRWNA